MTQHLTCKHSRTGIDGPTTCMANPDVMENIKDLVKSEKILSIADSRLARDAGILGIAAIERLAMNDGVIYATDDAAGPAMMGLAPNASPSARASLQLAKGKMNCLVLLVDFPGNLGQLPPAHFQSLLFDQNNPNSMRSFYAEMSYRKLDVDGVVTNWITAPHPYSFYTNQTSGTGNTFPNNTPGLLTDILNIYTANNSLAPFDVNADGYVDGLFLIHAGPGAEVDPNPANRPNKIWSHKWVLPQPYVRNGVKAFAYFTAPEDGKLGVFAHEFGHFIGLPDLYDTSYRSRGIGDWCLMAGGSWNGGGNMPARMSAWCLAELGWIKPKKVSGTLTVQLKTLEIDAAACYRLSPRGTPKHEYFLVENRQKAGRDIGLPGSGLAIWHVDKSQSSNSNALSYMVGLVQADGRRDLEFNRNSGDPGDVFPGSKNVKSVGPASLTQPNTALNSGLASSVAVSAITILAAGLIGATLKN